MARVKLELPETFVFSTEMPLRIGDINYGGHLGNDSVLGLVHEARVRFLRANGFSEIDIGGVGLILSDAVVMYRAEAFYGDVITIDVAVGDFWRAGCDIFYRLSNQSSGVEVARVKTGIVFFDYDKRKTTSVPAVFQQLFDKG